MRFSARYYRTWKSTDWKQNRPFPVAAWTATELAQNTSVLRDGPRKRDGGNRGRPDAVSGRNRRRGVAAREDDLRVYSPRIRQNRVFRAACKAIGYGGRRHMPPKSKRSLDVRGRPSLFIGGEAIGAVYQSLVHLKRCKARVRAHARRPPTRRRGSLVQQEQPDEVNRLLLGFRGWRRVNEWMPEAQIRLQRPMLSADERALDVDHILPRKHRGDDTLDNLQALCWLCNTNKGAGDDTDFRAVRAAHVSSRSWVRVLRGHSRTGSWPRTPWPSRFATASP